MPLVTIPPEILEQCLQYGAQAYPEECCGLLSGPLEPAETVDQAHPMPNLMDKYHAMDPQTFPRTNRNGYMLDSLKHQRLEKELRKQQRRIKVIYHSHPDVGAYFSEKDQADALHEGKPLYPNVSYLICAVNDGKPEAVVLAHFDDESSQFVVEPIR